MSSKNTPVTRYCPICEGSLLALENESVIIDVCKEHGVFLDHGELAVLERRAIRGVRIGLHASVEHDSFYRFRKPRRRGDDNGDSAEGILSKLLYCKTPDIYRPEDVDQQEAPKLDRSNQQVVPDGMRGCPQCNAIMQLDERKDVWGRTETVVIDTCAEHGVWLDLSELAILLDRSNQQARRDARRMRGRAIQRARESTRYRSY